MPKPFINADFNFSLLFAISFCKKPYIATVIGYDRKSRETTVNRDLPQPVSELGDDEDSVMMFVAMVEDGERPEIAVQQFTKRLGGPDLLDHPVVQETLKELVEKF